LFVRHTYAGASLWNTLCQAAASPLRTVVAKRARWIVSA